MPNRDPSIDFDDLPPMQAEKREDIDATQEAPIYSTQTTRSLGKKSIKPDSQSHSAMSVAVLALILAGVALAFAGVQLVRQSEKIENAELRVAELEKRLSSTDESVSQSGVALQVTIKELKDRVDELWTQMDKLWASAWRRNQTEITEHGSKIESIGTVQEKNKEKLAKLNEGINQSNKTAASLKEDIIVLQAKLEDLNSLDKTVKQQAKLIAELKSKADVLEKLNAELKKQNEDQAGWIASNNEFRQQTNKSLIRMEQQLKMLQTAPK